MRLYDCLRPCRVDYTENGASGVRADQACWDQLRHSNLAFAGFHGCLAIVGFVEALDYRSFPLRATRNSVVSSGKVRISSMKIWRERSRRESRPPPGSQRRVGQELQVLDYIDGQGQVPCRTAA